jgi:hypothetical protein
MNTKTVFLKSAAVLLFLTLFTLAQCTKREIGINPVDFIPKTTPYGTFEIILNGKKYALNPDGKIFNLSGRHNPYVTEARTVGSDGEWVAFLSYDKVFSERAFVGIGLIGWKKGGNVTGKYDVSGSINDYTQGDKEYETTEGSTMTITRSDEKKFEGTFSLNLVFGTEKATATGTFNLTKLMQ